jgi:hypothetical protein
MLEVDEQLYFTDIKNKITEQVVLIEVIRIRIYS